MGITAVIIIAIPVLGVNRIPAIVSIINMLIIATPVGALSYFLAIVGARKVSPMHWLQWHVAIAPILLRHTHITQRLMHYIRQ